MKWRVSIAILLAGAITGGLVVWFFQDNNPNEGTGEFQAPPAPSAKSDSAESLQETPSTAPGAENEIIAPTDNSNEPDAATPVEVSLRPMRGPIRKIAGFVGLAHEGGAGWHAGAGAQSGSLQSVRPSRSSSMPSLHADSVPQTKIRSTPFAFAPQLPAFGVSARTRK